MKETEQKHIVTYEELDAIKYGDFEDKFAELGVPDAWMPGKKKDLNIKEALAQLKILRDLEAEGKDAEQMRRHLKIRNEQRKIKEKMDLDKLQTKKKSQQEKDHAKLVKKFKDLSLSKEEYEKHLNSTRQLMKQPTNSREVALILNRKANALDEIISGM